MRRHKLFWSSSYDRGLDVLLFLWPDIKKKYVDAELHICYGWDTFDSLTRGNPERQVWKKSVQLMIDQPGIFHHGRLGKKELKKVRQNCGIWAYPTYFTEINCITALETQQDGLVPVTMALGALNETVGSGVKMKGKITDPKTKDKYLEVLLEMMGDGKKWKEESKKAKKFIKKFNWSKMARSWDEVFKEPVKMPKVSIITPTIRNGWWNIMAKNITEQSYPHIEWLIIDDNKEDRIETAKKYAKKYHLDIKYIRGDKALGTYKKNCGLVRANNKGWKASSGELLVWLQDFILMPKNGIESLVDIYRHNPNAIIAPVDKYFHAEPANKKNKEDWWDGKTKIFTKEGWTNPRVKNEGIRESDNPFDYEANYGAIPKHILDRLNGWWEFMDDGLGYDNTEIALRAMETGSKLIVDDTNISECINIWPEVKGTEENILNRERMLNPPRYQWLVEKMKEGKMPLIRDEKLDATIKLDFEVPKDIKDEDCSEWIAKNTKKIVQEWINTKKDI